jgi:hypothetical protein
MNNWISVNDKLPMDLPSKKIEFGEISISLIKHVQYIVAVRNINKHIYVTSSYFDSDKKRFIGCTDNFHEDVEYWMSMPELPKKLM